MGVNLVGSNNFVVIGENIHTTRVVRRDGRRGGLDNDGNEAVLFKNIFGEPAFLTIPDNFKDNKIYREGRVKHFMIAILEGMSEVSDDCGKGSDFILAEVKRQELAGSQFLDLNVDEISYHLDLQKKAMQWVVSLYCTFAKVPPSIDSSSMEILEYGLETYAKCGSPQGPPMVNSASLERIDALDLVKEYDAHVVVTASGAEGMPTNDIERIDNVRLMLTECDNRGVSLDRVHIDGLVFPISVDQSFGLHYLEAVSAMRSEFGGGVHITGGLSNVSFGLPARRLINDTFIRLCMSSGVDSGILNPIESRIDRIEALDMETDRVMLAADMLLGKDPFCMNFIQAFRDGRLSA